MFKKVTFINFLTVYVSWCGFFSGQPWASWFIFRLFCFALAFILIFKTGIRAWNKYIKTWGYLQLPFLVILTSYDGKAKKADVFRCAQWKQVHMGRVLFWVTTPSAWYIVKAGAGVSIRQEKAGPQSMGTPISLFSFYCILFSIIYSSQLPPFSSNSLPQISAKCLYYKVVGGGALITYLFIKITKLFPWESVGKAYRGRRQWTRLRACPIAPVS